MPSISRTIGDIAVDGPEPNSTLRRLAMLNPAIRGIEGNLCPVYSAKHAVANKINLMGLGYGS